MGLLQLLTTSRTTRQIRKLAAVVADRSLTPVRHRLAEHVGRMSAAEARGYVRARAVGVVQREMNLVLSMEGRLPVWGHSELLRQATTRVVEHLLVELSPVQVAAPRWRKAG